MTPSYHQKGELYRGLGQLVRSGKPFSAAILLLIETTRGATRDLLAQIKRTVDRGATVGAAFEAQRPAVSPLESSIIGACERSGRLDEGCFYLSEYFTQLWSARKTLIRKLLYPAFILHMGIFVTGLPALVIRYMTANPHTAVIDYFKEVLESFAVVYAIGAICWVSVTWLAKQGARNASVDAFLRRLPVIGKLRRAYALGRFCATYEMQLKAGVNVMDSLASAGKASQSGLVSAAVRQAIPHVRSGSQVGPLLKLHGGTFSEELLRAIQIGEETGTLDAELKRLATEFQADAVVRLDFLAGFLFKAIYLAVGIYIGVRLAYGYLGYIDASLHSMDSSGI